MFKKKKKKRFIILTVDDGAVLLHSCPQLHLMLVLVLNKSRKKKNILGLCCMH